MSNRRGFVRLGFAIATAATAAWLGGLRAQSVDGTTNLIGTVVALHGEDIEVNFSQGTLKVRTNASTRIWKGEDGKNVSAIRVGDEVAARGVTASDGILLASEIWANITQLDGIVRRVSGNDVEVDVVGNDSVRQVKRVRLTNKTLGSRTGLLNKQDVQADRIVMVVGLELEDGTILASRFVVYENGRAVDSPGTKYRDAHTGKFIDRP